jgi:hypothetical protein
MYAKPLPRLRCQDPQQGVHLVRERAPHSLAYTSQICISHTGVQLPNWRSAHTSAYACSQACILQIGIYPTYKCKYHSCISRERWNSDLLSPSVLRSLIRRVPCHSTPLPLRWFHRPLSHPLYHGPLRGGTTMFRPRRPPFASFFSRRAVMPPLRLRPLFFRHGWAWTSFTMRSGTAS